MATSFEYPPAIARHRPIYAVTKLIQQGPLRFKHHFFLTRLKLAALTIPRAAQTDSAIARLNNEVVSDKYTFHTGETSYYCSGTSLLFTDIASLLGSSFTPHFFSRPC